MPTRQLITLHGEEIKAKDKVWHLRYGWGEVKELDSTGMPIKVKFKYVAGWFTEEGKDHKTDIEPVLFWDEVHITPPPKPKKMVKKWQWAFRLSTTGKYSISESREEPSPKWVNYQMIEGSEETVEE